MDEVPGSSAADLQREIALMRSSLSWKVTAPLRIVGAWIRSFRLPYRCMDIFKRGWRSVGSPCPRLVRTLRHGIVGRLWLAVPDPLAEAMERVRLGKRRSYPQAPVSVIVAARNNAPFLRECLRSILNQETPPLDIIYVDDGSTDGSADIAAECPGVTVLRTPHRGVVAARTAGVAASRGEYVLHVDGDDLLTPDFVTEHLRALIDHPEACFSYGPVQMFGAETTLFRVRPWRYGDLWSGNFVLTSALIRRSAFDAVGGWREGLGMMWDWDLALRLGRQGCGVMSSGVLLYRRHAGSQSAVRRRTTDDHALGLLYGKQRRLAARVSVCAILSGRLPDLLPAWIDALIETVRRSTELAGTPELVVLDNSPDGGMKPALEALLRNRTDTFRSVCILPYPYRPPARTEAERRSAISILLAGAYNRLSALADGDVLWFVEDDMVVPSHCCDALLRSLTDGITPNHAASALYRNRHADELVAHVLDAAGTPVVAAEPVAGVIPIDFAGTGCLMILRACADHPFTSHWRSRTLAHDWAWSEETRRRGGRIVLDPSVRCPHYRSVDMFV